MIADDAAALHRRRDRRAAPIGPRFERAFALAPVVLMVLAQVLLLGWRLDHLPPWSDEEGTRAVVTASWPDALAALHEDVHPPLYFVLARQAARAVPGLEPIVVLRALSAAFAVLTGLVVYRCWVADQPLAVRWWFAALWATSPYLLLYARMARSYTMQMFLAVLVVAAAERVIGTARRSPGDRRSPPAAFAGPLAAYTAAAVPLLYTQYLTGAAMIGAVGAVLLWQLARRPTPTRLAALVLPPAIIAVCAAPWIAHLAANGERFLSGRSYALTEFGLLDRAIALGYVLVSFSAGEALAAWSIPWVGLITLSALGLVFAGARSRPPWGATVAVAAPVGFIGAAHWVSYAFVAARLIFVYPFWLLLVAVGIGRLPRIGRVAGAALVVTAVAGTISYRRMEGFLNKAYVLPVDAIAARIATRAAAGDTVVLLDPHGINVDVGVRRRLPAGVPSVELGDRAASEARRQALAPNVRTIWIARGAVDRSPDRWVTGLETELASESERTVYAFTPYSSLDRLAMRLAGWPEQPTHVFELVELERAANGGQ